MTLEGVATCSSGGKRHRWSPSDDEAQKDWAIVSVESPNLASNDQPTFGVCLDKANTPMEEGVPIASPPSVEEVGMDATSGVVSTPAPLPKSTGTGPSKKRLPDRVLVSTNVPPLERVYPSTDIAAPDLKDALNIVRC